MPYSLLIRADANSQIGVGHVMRCLALAQAWQDSGGSTVFLSADLPASLEKRLAAEKVQAHRINNRIGSTGDAEATLAAAAEIGAEWVVVDGYEFSESYLATLHAAGRRVLALDDMAHLEHYPVSALLNQNLSAAEAAYRGRALPTTDLLMGVSFSLLRREFRSLQPKPSADPHLPRRVLVTFGGGDPENLTAALMRNLQRTARTDLHVNVLAGAANPHVPELRKIASEMNFACEVRVDVPNVAEVMVWADAAIAAAGSTIWELASLHVPALIGAIGTNQLTGLSALAAIPFFRTMKAADLIACDLGQALETLWAGTKGVASPTVDALGAVRVVDFLRSRIPEAVSAS